MLVAALNRAPTSAVLGTGHFLLHTFRQGLNNYQSEKSLLRAWCLIKYKYRSLFVDLN